MLERLFLIRIIGADPKLRRSLREKSCEASGRETLTHGEDNTIPRRLPRGEYDGWGRAAGHGAHGTHIAQTCHAGHAGAGRRWSEQQQFCRSASARLPRTRHPAALDPDDDDYAERSSEQDSRDGERKIQQVRGSLISAFRFRTGAFFFFKDFFGKPACSYFIF